MIETRTPSERISDEVTSWPGVSAAPGRFGSLSLRLGRRELGHLHGNHAAHFAFPRDVSTRLRWEGRVGPHPALPDSPGLAARRIEGEADIDDVIELLRLNYERLTARAEGR